MFTDKAPDAVLATITASPGRRILGIGSLWILSLMVIYVGIVQPPELGWQLFLFALGGGSIWIAEQMRRATAVTLELTREELRDTAGVVLARMDEVTGLDRGMFAFKPSNGFLLRLNSKKPRAWRPGLWWSLGSRVGVGGMTPAHQAKFMAEIIAAILAERDGE
ncbi:hypothetical protein [uncultured Tateyamaria sp.]|uniref:hypothetical protein n=1 Tax=uncultured Tateyamaria sp. TaxID=455651 RepID=UPI00260B14DA|nr:hypothetical protein [uncultured Tateyamaria sp.]